MNLAADHKVFAHFAGDAPARRDAAPHGVLRRAFDALYEWRLRRAERDIAGFIERSGGHLTDDIERRMMERVAQSGFNIPH